MAGTTLSASEVKSPEEPQVPSVDGTLTIKDILGVIPPEVFIRNQWKAWTMVLTNTLLVIAGYVGIVLAPWFLLPVLWVFTGTGLTGLFIIAHDCGHRSFAKRKWVNNWVGHLMLLPLLYPFHAWRLHHNQHHKHTNKLLLDLTWHPFTPEFYESLPWYLQGLYRIFRSRGWWLASIFHWAALHFNWGNFQGHERIQVKRSIFLVIATGAIVFPALLVTIGIWGVIKFWFVPWLVFHFWLSTFTLIHHTAPDIPFRDSQQWHETTAQLIGTVHCDYPAWIEFLCHDINVHIPHHISTAIPAYNLRQAYHILQEHWGELLHQTQFSWTLIKDITDRCHFYDDQACYRSFQNYFDTQK